MKTRRTHTLLRAFSIAFTLSLIISAFAGCKKDGGKSLPEGVIDISEYAIVRVDAADDLVISQTVILKNAIKNLIGNDLSVTTDATAAVEKEILIGKTNRPESQAALDKLAKATKDEAYIIDITDNKISIVGTTDQATFHAAKMFVEDYVKKSTKDTGLSIAAGKTSANVYNSESIEILENGVEIETVLGATDILTPGFVNSNGTLMDLTSASYPSIVKLQHQPNPEDNGKLIVLCCHSDSMFPKAAACFMESSDNGRTWSFLSRPTEQNEENIRNGLTPGHMANLYELPEAIGKYPAGTLVYASGSINYQTPVSQIWVWYSTDCGKTWTQTAKLAEGGGPDPNTGVWEPYSIYEDGYLYCFYSDASAPNINQEIVYRRTKDGVNWEDVVEVTALDNSEYGVGMPVVTKMGNGEFVVCYESYTFDSGNFNGEVHFKKTSNIADWGDPNDFGTLLSLNGQLSGHRGIGATACIWTPAGGECGTLIISAKKEKGGDGTHRLFVSFDYGETWTTMTNPLPYQQNGFNGIGHRAAFLADPDGRTIYYANATNIPGTANRRVQFSIFRVY